MPFPEPLKLEVRRKANFRCCCCRQFYVEIHHIIPQFQGGKDDADNAAPLCPSCHMVYGNNPDFRKTIRDARDLWYELCAKNPIVEIELINSLAQELSDLKNLVNKLIAPEEPQLLQVLPDPNIFYLNENTVKQIPDPPTLTLLGFRWGQVNEITKEDFNKYQELAPFTSIIQMQLIKHRNVYYGLFDGELREIPNESTLQYITLVCGNRNEPVVVDNLQGYRKGKPFKSVS